MLNNYNLNGLKYFIYLSSLCDYLYYLPIEIRKIIWKKYHTVLTINCYICNTVLVNFEIYNYPCNRDNYSIINGIAKCNKCFID